MQAFREWGYQTAERGALSVFKVDVTTTTSASDDIHPLNSYTWIELGRW